MNDLLQYLDVVLPITMDSPYHFKYKTKIEYITYIKDNIIKQEESMFSLKYENLKNKVHKSGYNVGEVLKIVKRAIEYEGKYIDEEGFTFPRRNGSPAPDEEGFVPVVNIILSELKLTIDELECLYKHYYK